MHQKKQQTLSEKIKETAKVVVKAKEEKEYSISEVAQHCKEDDCWMVIGNERTGELTHADSWGWQIFISHEYELFFSQVLLPGRLRGRIVAVTY